MDEKLSEEILQVASNNLSALLGSQRVRDVVGDGSNKAVEDLGCRQNSNHHPDLLKEAFAVVFQEFREPTCEKVHDVYDSSFSFNGLAHVWVGLGIENNSEVIGPLFKRLFEVVWKLFDCVERLVDAESVNNAGVEYLFLFDCESICFEILKCILRKLSDWYLKMYLLV